MSLAKLRIQPTITAEIGPEVEEVLAMQLSLRLRTVVDQKVKRVYSADLTSVPKYFNIDLIDMDASLIGIMLFTS